MCYVTHNDCFELSGMYLASWKHYIVSVVHYRVMTIVIGARQELLDFPSSFSLSAILISFIQPINLDLTLTVWYYTLEELVRQHSLNVFIKKG